MKIGVEIEVANSFGAQAPKGWERVKDGSVDGPAPAEFRFTGPSTGWPDLTRRLKALAGAQQIEKFEINSTCGLHVHLDMRGTSQAERNRFLFLFEAVEPLLFALVPPSRRNNKYCRPVSEWCDSCEHECEHECDDECRECTHSCDCDECEHDCRNSDYACMSPCRHECTVDDECYEKCRYHALNLKAYEEHGSYEVRLHAGTSDARKIREWVLFLQRIWLAAKRMSSSQISQIYRIVAKKSTATYPYLIRLFAFEESEQKYWFARYQKFSEEGDK